MDEKIICRGKALVMAIQGLQALYEAGVEISAIETSMRPQLIKTYQRELRAIVAQVSPENAGKILAAMQNARLPTGDPGLN